MAKLTAPNKINLPTQICHHVIYIISVSICICAELELEHDTARDVEVLDVKKWCKTETEPVEIFASVTWFGNADSARPQFVSTYISDIDFHIPTSNARVYHHNLDLMKMSSKKIKLKMATWIEIRTFLVIEIANLFHNMIMPVCPLHNKLLSGWSITPSCVLPGSYSFQTWVSLNLYDIFLAKNWEGRPIIAFDPVCIQCIGLHHRSTAFLNFLV